MQVWFRQPSENVSSLAPGSRVQLRPSQPESPGARGRHLSPAPGFRQRRHDYQANAAVHSQSSSMDTSATPYWRREHT